MNMNMNKCLVAACLVVVGALVAAAADSSISSQISSRLSSMGLPKMNLPSMPNMPNMPNMPKMNMPDMPNMPDMNMPDLSKIRSELENIESSMPSARGLTKRIMNMIEKYMMPNLPSIPGMSSRPKMPNL